MQSVTAPQEEKPKHYTYLKSFRTEHCPDFVNHRCKQHRPFTCFNYHFPNQRRRRPVRKRDGSFNYSAKNYCTKYDETSGVCPNGDGCPYLHRNVGDTERHYHLRYYKTEQCKYELNSAGHCSRNGPHCMFAHGPDDCRKPVYDSNDYETSFYTGNASDEKNGFDIQDKTSLLDPKWENPQYILAHYKTERCPDWNPSSGRMCRLGQLCPYFHSNKDRRRSLSAVKYRAVACAMVRNKDEWGDPDECDTGENCTYCHSRMELQYHPDVYKTLKCEKNGQCAKRLFCAFSHANVLSGSRESLIDERSKSDLSTSVNKSTSSGISSQIQSNANSKFGLNDINYTTGNSSHMDPDGGFQLPANSDASKLPAPSELTPSCESSGEFPSPLGSSNDYSLAPGAEISDLKNLSEYNGSSMYRNQVLYGSMWPTHEYASLKMDIGSAGYLPYMAPSMREPMLTDLADRQRRQQILKQEAAHLRPSALSSGLSKFDQQPKLSSADTNSNLLYNRFTTLGLSEGNSVNNVNLPDSKHSPSHSSSDFSPSAVVRKTSSSGIDLLESPDDVRTGINFFPSATEMSPDYLMLVRTRIELDRTKRCLEFCEAEKMRIMAERDKALEDLKQCKLLGLNGLDHHLRSLHPSSSLNELPIDVLQQIKDTLMKDVERMKSVIIEKGNGNCLKCLKEKASMLLPLCHRKVLCEFCLQQNNECPICHAGFTLPQ